MPKTKLHPVNASELSTELLMSIYSLLTLIYNVNRGLNIFPLLEMAKLTN